MQTIDRVDNSEQHSLYIEKKKNSFPTVPKQHYVSYPRSQVWPIFSRFGFSKGKANVSQYNMEIGEGNKWK